MKMKTYKMILAMMMAAAMCTEVAAQGFAGAQKVDFPEGSYSPVTNVNHNGFPRVLKDNSVMFRTMAPEATDVKVDICGTNCER